LGKQLVNAASLAPAQALNTSAHKTSICWHCVQVKNAIKLFLAFMVGCVVEFAASALVWRRLMYENSFHGD